jgi:predicted nucleic acid-binding protein
MYRIYLDWNTISYLKNLFKNGEKSDIINLIENYQADFLFPYSPAHVQDLAKGAEKPENLEYIKADLDFLDKISKQHCIQIDVLDSSNIKPFIGSAHHLLDSIIETNMGDLFNPINLEKSFDNTFLPNFGKEIVDIWKRTPVDTKFITAAENTKEAKAFYDKYFRRIQTENTTYNLMLDFSDFYKELKTNPEIYNLLANILRTQVNINPKEVSNFKNPIEELNVIFKNSTLKMDFDELSTIKSDDSNKLLNSNFTKYALEYGNLDMSGFHPEKLNKKNLYSNFTNDSHHSYYAGYCDCLVSFDKKLLYKSEALYKKYRIETKTYTPQDFVNHYSKLVKDELNIISLFEAITDTIENELIDEILDHNFEESRLFLFRPINRIFSYFNFLYVAVDKDDRKTILLRHVRKNFSYFDFYIEWENVIEKCTKVFGNDLNGKNIFTDEEKMAFNIDNWTGRIWVIQGFVVELIFDKVTYGLELIFEQITDKYLDKLKG